MTRAEKVTISLPAPLLQFVTQYQQDHAMSRSEVFQQLLIRFREEELGRAYAEAAQEMRSDPLFDLDSGHGLTPEQVEW